MELGCGPFMADGIDARAGERINTGEEWSRAWSERGSVDAERAESSVGAGCLVRAGEVLVAPAMKDRGIGPAGGWGREGSR